MLFQRLSRPCAHNHGWNAVTATGCISRRAASTNASSRRPSKPAHATPVSFPSVMVAQYSTDPISPSRNSPSKSDRNLPSSRTIRISPHKREPPVTLRSSKDVYRQPEPPVSPTAEAIAAAETRSAVLNAARLRRSLQREEEAAAKAKKDEEKKKYQKRYKSNTRKWISTMIALPIFFVTSYYLFDRRKLNDIWGWVSCMLIQVVVALGNAQKEMPKLDKHKDQ